MGDRTGIEWTDATWNPIRGCSRVSPGCVNCYAETVAARFSGEGQPYHGLARRRSDGQPTWTGRIGLVEEHLADPLRWQRPRRVFVNSMSDLFHDGVPDSYIARVFAVMALAQRHTFQVLTKRPARMAELLRDGFRDLVTDAAIALHADRALGRGADCRWMEAGDAAPWPLPNVWLGVSVEDQRAAEQRVLPLIQTPAAVRFLSCEPLLGPVDLTRIRVRRDAGLPDGDLLDARTGEVLDAETGCIIDEWDAQVDWVIVGGESGAGARPMHPDWARALRDQCAPDYAPAFFFKQWGEWTSEPLTDVRLPHVACLGTGGDRFAYSAAPDGRPAGARAIMRENGPGIWEFVDAPPAGAVIVTRVGKRRAGRELDGRTWDEMPAAQAAAHG